MTTHDSTFARMWRARDRAGWRNFSIAMLALAVAFVVNLIAIPRMGSYGALIGLAAGYLAAASVNFYYIRFRLRV